MNRFLQLATALGWACLSLSAPALQISEPPTVFYGRVFQRGASQEFLLTEGELVWTIRNLSQGGHEYRLSARLEPLGGGRFSYRLSIPHQVLAYDLVVAPKAIPTSAVGSRLQHVGVTLNGQSVTIVAPAVDTFTAQQAGRALTYRIDLELGGAYIDSDGDDAPDWWEDQHGWDKWDPTDGANAALVSTGSSSNSSDGTATMTLEKWRQANFPAASGDLEQFAQADPDGDGIVNLLEYAFGLDPRAFDDHGTIQSLPRLGVVDGHPTLEFQKRSDAADLEYLVEISDDLIRWQPGAESVESVPAPVGAAGTVRYRAKPEAAGAPIRFLRVRVGYQP